MLVAYLTTLAVLFIFLVICLGHASPAAARATGIVTDSCQSCHGDPAAVPPTLTLTAEPATFSPGDTVTFTLTVRASSARVGGAFITTGGVGTLRALAGEGLQVNGGGLTHTSPKTAVNGAVTFRFGWQAPSRRGGVDVHVAALAGNGNNASTGDAPGSGDFQWAFGCAARAFYLDLDRDGYGARSLGTMLGCSDDAAPTGYASVDGDCDENDEKIHPGATETCNKKDDDCDGQIDEDSQPVTMWPDRDGDGYYKSQTGDPRTGCGNVPGYAAVGGDCDDTNAAIHPGATELCNLQDDNCDGQADERVRPQCGLGWCARYSLSCSPEDCHPGPPAKETCNGFDDDCDGQIDNDACTGGAAGAGGASGAGGAVSATGGAGAGAGGQGSPAGGSKGPSDARESGCAVLASPLSSSEPPEWGRPSRVALLGVGVMLLVASRRKRRR